MRNLIDQSGLIAGSDYLSLSRTMALRNSFIYDKITGAKHLLHPKAVALLKILERRVPYELWFEYAFNIDIKEPEITSILFSLNDIGALEIQRSFKGYKQVFYTQMRRLWRGAGPLWLTKRRPVNLANLCVTVYLAMLPLVLSILGVAILAYGINLSPASIVMASLGFIALIGVSTIIHEWVHSLIITRANGAQVLVQRGLWLGILHNTLPPKTEISSALWGPIAGSLVSATGGFVADWFYKNSGVFLLAGLIVAGLQLISLLPSYGDGRVIWKTIRREQYDS